MSYVRMFAPWVIYSVFAGESAVSQQWAALAALLLMGVSLTVQLRRGQSPRALIIEIGSAVFFAAAAVVGWAIPDSGALRYMQAAASAVLAVVAWPSLAVGHPFALDIAKQSVPAEHWAEPLFIRTNQIITVVWAVAFAAQAIALAAATATHSGTLPRVLTRSPRSIEDIWWRAGRRTHDPCGVRRSGACRAPGSTP
jgi:hypothetical protein